MRPPRWEPFFAPASFKRSSKDFAGLLAGVGAEELGGSLDVSGFDLVWDSFICLGGIVHLVE